MNSYGLKYLALSLILTASCKTRDASETKSIVGVNKGWFSTSTDLIDILPVISGSETYFCAYYKESSGELRLSSDGIQNAKEIWTQYTKPGSQVHGPVSKGDLQSMFTRFPELNNFYDASYFARTVALSTLMGFAGFAAYGIATVMTGGTFALAAAVVTGVGIGSGSGGVLYFIDASAEDSIVADRATAETFEFDRRLKERADAHQAGNWNSPLFQPLNYMKAGKLDIRSLFTKVSSLPIAKGSNISCPTPSTIIAELDGNGRERGILATASSFKWVVEKGVKLHCDGEELYFVKKYNHAGKMISVVDKNGIPKNEFDIDSWRSYLRQAEKPVGKLILERNAIKSGQKTDKTFLQFLKNTVETPYQLIGKALSVDGPRKVIFELKPDSELNAESCNYLKEPMDIRIYFDSHYKEVEAK